MYITYRQVAKEKKDDAYEWCTDQFGDESKFRWFLTWGDSFAFTRDDDLAWVDLKFK